MLQSRCRMTIVPFFSSWYLSLFDICVDRYFKFCHINRTSLSGYDLNFTMLITGYSASIIYKRLTEGRLSKNSPLSPSFPTSLSSPNSRRVTFTKSFQYRFEKFHCQPRRWHKIICLLLAVAMTGHKRIGNNPQVGEVPLDSLVVCCLRHMHAMTWLPQINTALVPDRRHCCWLSFLERCDIYIYGKWPTRVPLSSVHRQALSLVPAWRLYSILFRCSMHVWSEKGTRAEQHEVLSEVHTATIEDDICTILLNF